MLTHRLWYFLNLLNAHDAHFIYKIIATIKHNNLFISAHCSSARLLSAQFKAGLRESNFNFFRRYFSHKETLADTDISITCYSLRTMYVLNDFPTDAETWQTSLNVLFSARWEISNRWR